MIDQISVKGNDEVTDGELIEQLASQESGKFLWLIQGLLVEYQIFNQHVLQRDLERVERYYKARGFYQAQVRAGRVFETEDKHVKIEILVEEGEPTKITTVDVLGTEKLSSEERATLQSIVDNQTGVGKIIEESALSTAKNQLGRELQNSGFAYSSVEGEAFVDLSTNQARIVYQLTPKEKAFFGAVTIRNLGNVPEAPVRNALGLVAGDPFSNAELEDAKQALLDLGIFSSVDIEAKLDAPPQKHNVVPVVVTVALAPTRSVKLGGGVELDVIQTGMHAIAGWEHRNLFGGLRKFRAEARPGFLLYPTRLPTFETPTHVLPVVRLNARFEQPGFIEPRTTGILNSGYDIVAVLFLSRGSPEAPIVGYREARASAALQRRFSKLTVTPSLNVQTDVPFAYAGTLSDKATSVFIYYTEIDARWDLRDNSINPTQGAFASFVGQYADFGGDANDFRIQPEFRFYVPVPGAKANVAIRASTGFLFPLNYETYGGAVSPSVQDSQIAYFRSFFSGGPNSNRGYPFRGVGPHGPVEFFNPDLAADQTLCDPQSSNYNDSTCSFPLGGLSLWEASVEFRYEISGPFSSALFCDASEVVLEQFALSFSRPHVSCGAGLRYATPVGPIRFDLGYRIPGLQVLGSNDRIEGDPGMILGLPMNASFGIGEAF